LLSEYSRCPEKAELGDRASDIGNAIRLNGAPAQERGPHSGPARS